MSDKQDRKARKLEERNKQERGHSGSLPAMGGPGMVPHHNYGIPAENFHSGGRLAYGPGLGQLMGQSIPMGQMGPLTRVPSGLSNDMGPPIFMPSLNLGTPKLAGNTTSVGVVPPNSKLNPAVMNSSAAAAFMTDILTYHHSPQTAPLPAFHSASLKSVPYMPTPPSVSSSRKGPPLPNTSLAKPTPISVGAKVPVTRVVSGGMDREAAQPAFSSGSLSGKASKPSMLLPSGSEGSGPIKEEGGLPSQSYYPQPPLLSSPSNSLSKMLMAPSSPAQGSEHQVQTDGSKVLSTGGGVAPPTTATSGQPSSNVSFADTTRMDRPPHPSAPHVPMVPGAGLPKEPTQQQHKERLTTAEVASNIIISNPGLTGKHIAAMTNSTQQPSTLLPHSAYSSPIISQAELLPGPALLNMPQHMVDTGWGFSPQYNSNNVFNNTLSPPVSMTAGPEMLTQQSNGGGLKSRLEAAVTSLPQSPLGGGAGGVVQSSGPSGEQNVLNSPGQVNSSPRPRILRGKRSVDGNWKLDGQSNATMHSPGSPRRAKLQASLKKSALVPPSSGGGGGDVAPPPASPGQAAEALNHLGGGNRVEDLSGSPRKKPRKQNVVANDDQYASNVPDTHQLSQQLSGEDGGGLLEGKLAGLRALCDRSTSPPPASGKEVVEIRYLSQLRKSPFPINGVYKLCHHTAHNHFRRYADIKHREALPISVYDLANDKSCQQRASGWKLFHFNSQLQEVAKVESDCLTLMEQTQSSLGTIMDCPGSLLDSEALRTTKELLQGNIDRCSRIQSHVDSTRTDMFMVMDHKSQVIEVLDKYSNFKSHYSSISPSLSSSSSSQQKSQS